jgi:hypothetical protein
MRKLIATAAAVLAATLVLAGAAPAFAQGDWLKQQAGKAQSMLGGADLSALKDHFTKKEQYPATKEQILDRTEKDPSLSDKAKAFVQSKLKDEVYKNPKQVLKVLGL